DDLDPLEFLHIGVPGGSHGAAERAHEVHGAVAGGSRAAHDLLQGADRADLEPLAPRQLVVVCFAAPVVAAAGGFDGAGQRGADHDRVGAAGQRFSDVAAAGHPAVRDDVDVAAPGLVEVVPPGRGDVADR